MNLKIKKRNERKQTLVDPLGKIGEIDPFIYNQNLTAYGNAHIHPLFKPFQNFNMSAFLCIQNQNRLNSGTKSGETLKINKGYWKREAREAVETQSAKFQEINAEVVMNNVPMQRKIDDDMQIQSSKKNINREEQIEEVKDNMEAQKIFKSNNETTMEATKEVQSEKPEDSLLTVQQ